MQKSKCWMHLAQQRQSDCPQQGEGRESIAMFCYCFVSQVNLPSGCNRCHVHMCDPIVQESINSFRAYLTMTIRAATWKRLIKKFVRALDRSLSNQDWLSHCSTSGYESRGPLVMAKGQGLHWPPCFAEKLFQQPHCWLPQSPTSTAVIRLLFLFKSLFFFFFFKLQEDVVYLQAAQLLAPLWMGSSGQTLS